MRKTLIILAAVTSSILMIGCQESLSPQKSDEYVNNVVSDIKDQAAEELKKAFVNEIDEFFKSDDLTTTLGISSEEQSQVEASIRQYLDDYSMDEEKLSEAKKSLDELLENAQELSPEELEDKLAGIFKE